MTASRYAELDKIYAQLPVLECKGKCQASCGPIPCTDLERERILKRTGRELRHNTKTLTCSKLVNGKCSVYTIRPMICRLWGMVDDRIPGRPPGRMRCPHGCQPTRYLSDVESYVFLNRVEALDG